MKNQIKINNFHIPGSLQRVVNQQLFWNKTAFDANRVDTLKINLLPLDTTIVELANRLVQYLGFIGKSNLCRRRLGKDWQKSIIKAVICDYLMTVVFIWKVQNGDSYLDRYDSYFPKGYKFFPGTQLLMKIFSAKRDGFEVRGTRVRFGLQVLLKDPNPQIHTSSFSTYFTDDEWKSLVANNFKDDSILSPVAWLKDDVIKDLALDRPVLDDDKYDMPSIGDLIKSKNSPENSWLHLHTDGVSQHSQAMNVIFKPEFENNVVNNIDLHQLIYFPWQQPFGADVDNYFTLIWFGIEFTAGSSNGMSTGGSNFNQPGPGPSPDLVPNPNANVGSPAGSSPVSPFISKAVPVSPGPVEATQASEQQTDQPSQQEPDSGSPESSSDISESSSAQSEEGAEPSAPPYQSKDISSHPILLDETDFLETFEPYVSEGHVIFTETKDKSGRDVIEGQTIKTPKTKSAVKSIAVKTTKGLATFVVDSTGKIIGSVVNGIPVLINGFIEGKIKQLAKGKISKFDETVEIVDKSVPGRLIRSLIKRKF